MTNTLVISGKKQAGKDTATNYITGTVLHKHGFIDGFGIDYQGRLSLTNTSIKLDEVLNKASPYIKKYSFADEPKRICIEVLGLRPEQCFGSNADKETLTDLLWENMPTQTSKTGRMTAREVMQYVGTEVFRAMYHDVWVDACWRKIEKDQPELAIIYDCRFPNEVLNSKAKGGRVIRLTRNILNDSHESETALDPEKFDWSHFDLVIDNQHMTLVESCEALENHLTEWGWL